MKKAKQVASGAPSVVVGSPGVAGGGGRPARGVTADGRLVSGRLAGRTMNQAIFVLTWPVLVESFLNSFVGLTDTALAARLPNGEAATDAIGGASYIMWFIGLVFMALGIGATALVSRSIGKGRLAVANAVLGQTLTLGVVIGTVTAGVVALGAPWVAGLLNMTPDATGAMTRYMLVIAAGVPGATVLFALIACARGAGDSVSPLKAMMVRNVVNVAVSWALCGAPVLGFSGPFDMGVTGIAIGTVVGDLAGAGVVLTMAVRGSWGIRLIGRRLKPHWHTMRRLIRLGIPNFLETLGMWVGNFIVVVMVGWLAVAHGGQGLLGAHIIGIRVEALSFLMGFAVSSAAATLAGQYLGAGSPAMAGRAVTRCAALAAAMMGVMGVVFIAVPEFVTRIMSEQAAHLEHTPGLLWVCGFIQVPFALAIVSRAALRGAGDVRVVMVITWVCTYFVRLPLAYFFSGVDVPLPESLGGGVFENPGPWDGGLMGVWIGLCAEHVIRGAMFGVRFLSGAWKNARV